mmetsp:Transcript_20286/g.33162  ORF Transcript_20286/g.33162 Transcript_20286/m.33162 type:complete len:163 (-) Transcript_20286:3-491(-)
MSRNFDLSHNGILLAVTQQRHGSGHIILQVRGDIPPQANNDTQISLGEKVWNHRHASISMRGIFPIFRGVHCLPEGGHSCGCGGDRRSIVDGVGSGVDGAPLAEFEDCDCCLLACCGTAGEGGDAYQGCDEFHDYNVFLINDSSHCTPSSNEYLLLLLLVAY